MATHRPQHRLSLDMLPAPVVGNFVFYASAQDDALVQAGVIVAIDAARCLVHQYRQAPKRDRQFMPLYFDADTKTHVPRIKPTASMEAVIVTVPLSNIVTFGAISATNYVDNTLFDRLASMGSAAQR